MNEEHFKDFRKSFEYFYPENPQAVQLCMDLVYCSDKIDDSVDEGSINNQDSYQLFTKLLVDIPSNPVYQLIGHELRPILLNVMLNWQIANDLETRKDKTDDDLNKCYMLRASLYDIFSFLAYKLYGVEWFSRVGPDIKRLYGESLEEYKEEMSCQIHLQAE